MNESARPTGVTIVTQTRVHAGSEDAFAQFQARISAEITGQAGFIEQSVLPPNPPAQPPTSRPNKLLKYLRS